MGLFDRIIGKKKGPRQQAAVQMRPLRGRYDAAQTTQDNLNHWVMADPLSPDASMTPAVRRVLRNRARYESGNNSYCRGIVLTLANDTVGTGPRLKVNTRSSAADRAIETAFHEWIDNIGLAQKLRTMVQARCVDGEAFAMMVTNPRLEGVQLDLRLIEADQIATPTPWLLREVDGIEYDKAGNPLFYHMLKSHPGALYQLPNMEYDRIDASMMMHVYRPDRPGQHRGIPELTPALPLFAMLRRYTLATLSAAETAADFAAVLFTNAPAQDLPEVEPFVPLNIQPRSMMALPEGWQLGQMQSEQPTTTYGNFKTEILNEIARCLNMPFNIAACNSSAYNYSSGRLDHQTYFKSLRVDREAMRQRVLDRLFRAWVDEASLVSGVIPQGSGPAAEWNWEWVWDGNEHIDPQAEAQAQVTRLESNTTTLAAEYAKLGMDWELALEQRAREVQKMRELGLLTNTAQPAGAPAATPQDSPEMDEDNADEEDIEDDLEMAEGFTPPKAAQSAAARGLELRREYGVGGTAVGVARARDIANGKALSEDTIGRMVSFFARHAAYKKNHTTDPPNASYISWLLWGGDAGRRWSLSVWKKLQKA